MKTRSWAALALATALTFSMAAAATTASADTSAAPAPQPTKYKSKFKVLFTQQANSTKQTLTLPNLKKLKSAKYTKVKLTAKILYNKKATRTLTKTLTLKSFKKATWDLKDYGKFTVTAQFYKGKRVVTKKTFTQGSKANEYNIAALGGTLPVTMFSLSLFGADSILKNAKGERVPTVVLMKRTSQWNWKKLPTGVYSLPTLSVKDGTNPAGAEGSKFNSQIKQLAAYVKDLVSLNKKSVVNFYVNDYFLGQIQQVIYANKIPENRYRLYVLSDGTFSYTQFAANYDGTDPATLQKHYAADWASAKAYAYKNGTVKSGFSGSTPRKYLWTAVDSEPNAQWWVGRKDLITSPDDGNAYGLSVQANAKVKQVAIATQLKSVQASSSDVKKLKALYNFGDTYFAAAEKAGKKAMLLLGTYVNLETDFDAYAGFVKAYYGSSYLYYYKGHPKTPTALWPEKTAQLKKLAITDVDSTVPAELILFFNPTISLSGYGSSTYAAVTDPAMAKVLFGYTKAAALAVTGSDYTIMDAFAYPIASGTPAVQALGTAGDLAVDFSDAVAAAKGYDVAVYTPSTNAIKYYKASGAGYTPVG
ncbi:MAG: hypothetical protein LBR21_09580 [Propionibacteriaceae bacterium]|jgi:hypothetical protein|nr:hypothetical protein [Propionibacteriaceae bacterium]